ncbi:hypothetical protein D6789_04665 [Candidatus Woesearchaeota archaeon]|nr:MAG: hypothetical protein D6789_04665 [Candidatus Woesearchaeota archaeon]
MARRSSKRSPRNPRRNFIIGVALFMSALLYLAGVLSGLYANKILEERTNTHLASLKNETEQDIRTLQEGTQEELQHLQNYINFLETTLKSMQLERLFAETLSQEQACAFSALSMQYLITQLQVYREQLPFRIEAYERDNELSEEYLQLKEQYNALSVQAWIVARNQHLACGTDLVYGLYFYSRDCENCVRQGEELDTFTLSLQREGKDVMLFTIDADSDDPLINIIKNYYSITAVPALIINDNVYQGRVFTANQLKEAVA